MIAAWLAFFDGLLAIVIALAGMVAAHWALTPSIVGFQFLLLALFLAVLGVIIGIVAILVTSLVESRRPARPRAIIGVILSLIVLLPVLKIYLSTRQYPLINDITTDTQHPLEFVHAPLIPANHGRDMNYDPKFAEIQEASPVYKNLGPLKLDRSPDDVYKKVEIIAGEFPGWRVDRNDPASRTIEGVATSKIFQFKDDFIIQVRPGEGGQGSLVEMRSKSRDGKGDLGVNYNRIVAFFKALQGSPRGVRVPSQGAQRSPNDNAGSAAGSPGPG